MNRGALTAAAEVTVVAGGAAADGGRFPPQIRWSQAWPVVVRRTGTAEVHLVHGAGGPLGGDRFALDLALGSGAALQVRSAAATIVQPGAGDAARWSVRAALGPAARLVWRPEPTVVCDGAALDAELRLRLEPGAGAVLREVVVLGRLGERGGRYRGELRVDVGGTPLLAHRTVLDGTDPALCGPAGTAGARAVGTVVWAGAAVPDGRLRAGAAEAPGLRWAYSELEGPGRVLLAVGEPRAVGELLDAELAAVGAAASGGDRPCGADQRSGAGQRSGGDRPPDARDVATPAALGWRSG
ncbi:MAG TPA: urease accessory protein UreD [Pseudonocardia sp.]|nr:urease accessory protein UreD [Pseudonocardia sp.]